MVDSVPSFIKRAAERTGFRRERYIERNMPTAFDNVVVLPFYGDMRSEFVLSSLLLHRVRNLFASKYLIVCSYPGRDGLYPCADEYWSFQDETVVRSLADGAVGFGNSESDHLLFQEQHLNRFFENVLHVEDWYKYYHRGFNKLFFDEFKWVVYNLPSIPSSRIEFNRDLAQRSGYKVFVHPVRTVRAWDRGREVTIRANKKFWYYLIDRLVGSGFTPVVWQDFATFDVSSELENKCVYVSEPRILDVLGIMRTTGFVLDVFEGLGRFATAARVPFLSCTERRLYGAVKEYEIDGLCNTGVPHRYIFSFPTIVEGNVWSDFVDTVVGKMEAFIPGLNRDAWPSTAEQSAVVPYGLVKEKKRKKIGARFIKVDKF